jgi:hypothetical protein
MISFGLIGDILKSEFARTAVKAAATAVVDQAAAAAIDRLRQDRALESVIDRLVGSGLNSAAGQVLRWAAVKAGDGLPAIASTPPALDAVGLSQSQDVATAVEAAAHISGTGAGCLRKHKDGRLDLLPPERRVGLGVTRAGSALQPILLLSSERAFDRVEDADKHARKRVVGFAASRAPEPGVTPRCDCPVHRPGRSIGHQGGSAGSLGLYVTYADRKRRRKGFLGAAHVLIHSPDVQVGDHIHSPGAPPEDYRDILYRYGKLRRGRALTHFTESRDYVRVVNSCDVALASLNPMVHALQNSVPDPNDANRCLPVHDTMSVADIRDHCGSDVFLTGSRTPFSHGQLFTVDVGEYPVQMPDGKEYLFGNVCVVERKGTAAFSQSGDSGGLVYTLDDGDRCRALAL